MNRSVKMAGLVFVAAIGAAAAASAAVVTRGPYLQGGSNSSIVVRWRTDVPTDSRVSYGLAPDAFNAWIDHAVVSTEHEIRLDGLATDTRYYYTVGTPTGPIAGADGSLSFVTSPEPGFPKPMRVWVLGDAGTAGLGPGPGALQRAVRDGYARYNGTRRTDFLMLLGDNAYNSGQDAEYQAAIFDMYPTWLRESVVWTTRGNHEGIYGGANNDYYEFFTLPTLGEAGGVPSGSEAYYSFDYANVHFICLDSEGSSRVLGGPMLTWLESDVAATTRDWVVAFWHHPTYTKGSHDSDNNGDSGGRMRDMRQNVLPILEAAGVDLVLTGHSHSYERSFLLDGHYGVSSSLSAEMIKDGGDGRPDGDGVYVKTGPGAAPNEGAVYVVAGSAGQTSGGSLNHPVMITSQNRLGSLVLDIDNQRLEARFVDTAAVVRDSFVVTKVGPLAVDRGGNASDLAIDLSPNPGVEARIGFSLPTSERVRVSVLDINGRRLRTLIEGDLAAGRHTEVWDGRNDQGRSTPAGVYFVLLEAGTRTVARKLVRAR